MIIKICGIKNTDTLLCCENNKIKFFGMIFYPKSPRNISFKNASILQKTSKSLNINLNFTEDISVILKDSKGDPSRNRLTVTIDMSISGVNENLIASNVFSESFEYNIDDNKFNLKQYEKNLKFSLVEQITQQIIAFLANV